MSHDTTRIVVTNFDSVAQAQLWLERGATIASETLISMLRTAVLLGQELVIDRNQLLDGVFFLALGPDRIAAALGLAEGENLPIIMTCSPSHAEEQSPPPHAPRLLGTTTDPVDISLGTQLTQVRQPSFLRVSSALAAVTGHLKPNSWLTPAPGPEWYPGCGFTDRFHPIDPNDQSAAVALIHIAQQRWIDAAATGRISVDIWNPIDPKTMQRALARQRQQLADACGADLKPAPLANHVLNLTAETTARRAIVRELTQWRDAQPDTSTAQLRRALTLWTRAYYQAMAWVGNGMLIAFNTNGSAAEAGELEDEDFVEARRYGLAMKSRTRWERWRDRRSHRVHGARSIRVNGSILDDMRIIAPGVYRQVSRTSGAVVHELVRKGDAGAMFDLAYACRQALDTGSTRRRRRWVTGIRAVTMILLAVGVAALTLLGEMTHFTRGEQALIITSAALLGLLSSLPWDDMAEQFSLRPASMSATLNLKGDE